jgi:beta-ketoacyl-acyl-carrier-protein synthase II
MPGFAAAITGIGLVTPAGIGVRESWSGAVAGKATAATTLDLPGLPVRVVCRAAGFSVARLGLRNPWQFDLYSQFAIAAAREALESAGLERGRWADSRRVAVVLGTGAGGTATLEEQYRVLLQEGPGTVSPLTLPMGLVNMAAGQLAIDVGARGPCLAPCTACASGATALGIARTMLRDGTADIVIAGAAEAPVTRLFLAAFSRMGTLSRSTDPERASRPFDMARDGFVLGEGAGVFVLETEDHARARNAPVSARIVGYGATADAHHVTSPHPEGQGARSAMAAALADAGLGASDVRYVNAHGTSTQLNDTVEAAAIHGVLGETVPVSSTKGVTGHLLGAGAAVEAAFTALAVRDGLMPPTANLTDPDPRFEVDLIRDAARPGPVRYAMSNSFGFGGQNTSLVFAG